jgi:nicotinamidase/pyrazinamidase
MKKYLIIVDIQNDFTRKEGNLFVEGSNEAIKNINKLLEYSDKYDSIIATQDYHPEGHVSFASSWEDKKLYSTVILERKHPKTKENIYINQILWPDHCIAETWGSQFDDNLEKKYIDVIWRKGKNKNLDSYSAFLENDKLTETGLASYLNYDGQFDCEIDIVGVATDVCVYNTAVDCYNMVSHDVRVLLNCCAGVNKENTEKRIQELKDLGVKIIK